MNNQKKETKKLNRYKSLINLQSQFLNTSPYGIPGKCIIFINCSLTSCHIDAKSNPSI